MVDQKRLERAYQALTTDEVIVLWVELGPRKVLILTSKQNTVRSYTGTVSGRGAVLRDITDGARGEDPRARYFLRLYEPWTRARVAGGDTELLTRKHI